MGLNASRRDFGFWVTMFYINISNTRISIFCVLTKRTLSHFPNGQSNQIKVTFEHRLKASLTALSERARNFDKGSVRWALSSPRSSIYFSLQKSLPALESPSSRLPLSKGKAHFQQERWLRNTVVLITRKLSAVGALRWIYFFIS